MDIQRHLDNEPVMARPPSSIYRFQKMVRRHKLVVIASSAVVGSLLVGLSASTWFLLREKQARQETTAAHANESILRNHLRESVRLYAEVQAKVGQELPGEDAAALQRRTYNELAKQFGIDATVFQERLPQMAKELKNAPDTTPYERANAAFSTKDYADALTWYLEAAEAGNVQAQCNLGYMYEHSLGVPTNIPAALKWYQRAADAGNNDGRMGLGWIYEHGIGGYLDYPGALKWYRMAANAGDNRGRNALGWMSENGLGCEQNYAQAFDWFRTAAEAGRQWRALQHRARLRVRPWRRKKYRHGGKMVPQRGSRRRS